MTLPNWLSLAALVAATALLWSLRQVVLLMFAGVVLAMAICTLVGILRERRPMPRPTALLSIIWPDADPLGSTAWCPFIEELARCFRNYLKQHAPW